MKIQLFCFYFNLFYPYDLNKHRRFSKEDICFHILEIDHFLIFLATFFLQALSGSGIYEESRFCLNPAPVNGGEPCNEDKRRLMICNLWIVDTVWINTEIVKFMEKWIIAKKVYLLNG